MKKTLLHLFILAIPGILCLNVSVAQVVVSNTIEESMGFNESATLEVRSDNAGMLIPVITLTFDEGKISASGLEGPPADGLIIFHDGSNNISKGMWYYDADLDQWIIYTDYTSAFATQIENFGEIYEANSIGNGSMLTLYNTHYTPWVSANPGLLGPDFQLLDDQIITTEIGMGKADQLRVTGVDAVYTVNISATIQSSTSGNVMTGMLYINNEQVAHIFFRSTYQIKDDPTNCFTSGNIELHSGDKVDFRFTTTTALEGIEIEHFNLRLTKIGEI